MSLAANPTPFSTGAGMSKAGAASAAAETRFVYGPQGCGKSRCAEKMRRHFGCTRVVDEWTRGRAVVQGALHITHCSPPVHAKVTWRWVRFEDLPLEVRTP